MTKNEFLDLYKEVMGVDLKWSDVIAGLVVVILFVGFCSLGEIF